ncbi:spore germination lipoprotein GerD [Paenibacillus yanchengensis]|uniref:Spore germination lipoprotein GerD n=1 Tax=Paenibacillus yanchengensis TaxID=2035833 RepID=A0ABW4YHA6_9BACL
MRFFSTLFTIFFVALLTGCGSEPQPQQMNYKDMKSMVIDILKTEDAQKALQESAEKMTGYKAQSSQLLSVQDQEEVRLAVKEVISSPGYDRVIKSLMTDVRFAGEFAKAINKDNKNIHKQLIKDPTYQADMIKAMRTPEMDKLILEVLKSGQYRKELMSMIQDAMQNPIFRLEMLDLMKAAVKEELQIKPNEKVQKQKEEGQEKGQDEGQGQDQEQQEPQDGQSEEKGQEEEQSGEDEQQDQQQKEEEEQ